MNIVDDAVQIRELVKENELEQSLSRLFEFTSKNRKQDEVAVISARLKEIQRIERLGVSDFNTMTIERNKIRLAILDLVREVEADNHIIAKFEVEAITPLHQKNNFGEISGRWLDKSDDDIVFFQQRADKIIGIYDFGRRRKMGFYLGQIKGDILEYKWQWYERELTGYGQMIIVKGKMSGIWWYENFKKETEHVEYEYLV